MDLESIDAILRFAGLLDGDGDGDGGGHGSSGSGSGGSSASVLQPTPPFWSDIHPDAAETNAPSSSSDRAAAALRQRVRAALELVGAVLALFPLEALALTFNGGKDACVVFYLVRAAVALRARCRQQQERLTPEAEAEEVAAALRRVAVLYFVPRHGEFPEVQAFMGEVAAGAARWGQGACGGLDAEGGKGDAVRPLSRDAAVWGAGGLGRFAYAEYAVGYREGMADMVDHKGLKAVFMGVRSGDPYSCTCVVCVCGGLAPD